MRKVVEAKNEHANRNLRELHRNGPKPLPVLLADSDGGAPGNRPQITFVVDFTVSAKERPRMARNGHVYTPSKTRDCEKAIAIVALGARNAAGLFRPFRGDCHI